MLVQDLISLVELTTTYLILIEDFNVKPEEYNKSDFLNICKLEKFCETKCTL